MYIYEIQHSNSVNLYNRNCTAIRREMEKTTTPFPPKIVKI